MRNSLAFVLVATSFLMGCQTTSQVCSNKACQHKRDLESLASACVRFVEHTAPVSVIEIPDGLSLAAQRALALTKPTIKLTDAPKSTEWSILPGHFVLAVFEASDEDANCTGTLGPALPQSVVGFADHCGIKFDIPFSVEDGQWASHSYKITECSSTN